MKKNFVPAQESGARGATLLEILLVLSIAGLFLLLGMQIYQTFQNMIHLQELKFKVNELFGAASDYYRANCAAGDFSPKPPVFLSPYRVSTGTLDYPPSPDTYFPISIVSTLIEKGYLENWQPINPFVDPSGGESGYVVQLNPIISTQPIPVNACVVTNVGQKCLPITMVNKASPDNAYSGASGSTIPTTQALVVTWAVQVAVKVPPSKIEAYAGILGPDCMSDSSSDGSGAVTVDACAKGNSSHQYLVWSRIPSYDFKKSSIFSNSMQLLKQYTKMYTQDPYYAYSSGYSTTTNPAQAPVYYLCGG